MRKSPIILVSLLFTYGPAFAEPKLRVVGCPVDEYQCSGVELNSSNPVRFWVVFPDGDPPKDRVQDLDVNLSQMGNIDLTQSVIHCNAGEGQRRWSLRKNIFRLHSSCGNEKLDIKAICRKFVRVCTEIESDKSR
jgi:hypothetical protein